MPNATPGTEAIRALMTGSRVDAARRVNWPGCTCVRHRLFAPGLARIVSDALADVQCSGSAYEGRSAAAAGRPVEHRFGVSLVTWAARAEARGSVMGGLGHLSCVPVAEAASAGLPKTPGLGRFMLNDRARSCNSREGSAPSRSRLGGLSLAPVRRVVAESRTVVWSTVRVW